MVRLNFHALDMLRLHKLTSTNMGHCVNEQLVPKSNFNNRIWLGQINQYYIFEGGGLSCAFSPNSYEPSLQQRRVNQPPFGCDKVVHHDGNLENVHDVF